jgi:hypothetical protein
MRARWLLYLLFPAVFVSLCAAEARAYQEVPYLDSKRIHAHIDAYRTHCAILRWSKRLIVGGCGIAVGAYSIYSVHSWLSSHHTPPDGAPAPGTTLSSEERRALDTQFKQEQLKRWDTERKRRAYKVSYKGLFMQALRWTLMTSLAFTCGYIITHHTKSLWTTVHTTVRRWWRQDVTTYYHELYADSSKQARCMLHLLKIIEEEIAAAPSTGTREQALLHRQELLIFYSFFLRSLEKCIALMHLKGTEEVSFYIPHIVHAVHEASSALEEYIRHTDGNALALDSFLCWFNAAMYALEGASRRMVSS